MSYRFSTADRSSLSRLDHSCWQRSILPPELGDCFTDYLAFDDGLALVYSHFTPRQDLLESCTLEQERCLTVAIALEGQSSSTGVDGQRFDFVRGQSTIAAYASLRGERCYPANQAIRQLRLVAKAPLLRRYGLESLLDLPAKHLSASPLSSGQHPAATQRLAESLVHLHDCSGSLMDTHIAALSLLSEQVRPFTSAPEPARQLKGHDQDLMLRARDILASQFNRPLTVAYLCASVGTNEFKLKQGFRALFGTSPHRLLTDIRMAKAWELLETGQYVSSVAYQVGYQHLSSFSAAFERYYGRTPKSVQRHIASEPGDDNG